MVLAGIERLSETSVPYPLQYIKHEYIMTNASKTDYLRVNRKDVYDNFRNWLKHKTQCTYTSTKFYAELNEKDITSRKTNGIMVYDFHYDALISTYKSNNYFNMDELTSLNITMNDNDMNSCEIMQEITNEELMIRKMKDRIFEHETRLENLKVLHDKKKKEEAVKDKIDDVKTTVNVKSKFDVMSADEKKAMLALLMSEN